MVGKELNSEEKPDKENQPIFISPRLLSSRPILLIWIILFAAALVSYCLWNEPLRRAAIHLLPLATSLGFLLSICGIGFPLARRLAGGQDQLMQGITATVFGMGLTAILVFILGMAGFLSPIWLWCWVVLGAVLFLVACFSWRPFHLSVSLRNDWTTLSACVLTAFLGMSIPFVVAPEASTDALSYHLLIPKMYLTLGKVAHLPLFVESNYPSLAEYNYLLILRLSDEIVCKCFHFWVTILLLLCLSCVVRKITGKSSLLAPALFLSMPVTAIHIGWAWNDFIYTLMIVLSLFYLLNYHLTTDKARTGTDLLVAGLMAGLASWTKYTFAIFFLSILPLLLLGVRKWNWNNRKSLLFFAGILVVAPFWLVQNWIFTGNPVYPFLNHIFQSPYWTETADAYFHNALRRWEIVDWNWTTYFIFPVFITLKPRLVDIHTGILPLTLLPFLFVKSSNKGLTFLKYFVLSCTIVWLLIQTETRSIFSLFAVLFCILAVCIERWDWPGRFWKTAFAAFIILAVASNYAITLLTTYHLFDRSTASLCFPGGRAHPNRIGVRGMRNRDA